MDLLKFLQNNAQWICGFGMLIFAGVQVLLMFAHGRQQLRLKRLELVQQLDDVAFDFDGTRATAIKVQEWLGRHQGICALLLKKKDAKAIEKLFAYMVELRGDLRPINAECALERIKKFNTLVNDVTRCLGTARYGFIKENMSKDKK
jgi:hypothetical protein